MNILSIFQGSPLLAAFSVFSQSPLDGMLSLVIFLISIVAAVTVHEFAHAWVADYLGDDTPHMMGRVTLDPSAHLDPTGSVLFLILGFGWGRPVIYNPMRLSRRVDELYIALAGPIMNLLVALILNFLAFVTSSHLPLFATVMQYAAYWNVLLAAFNVIPIPPLDGSAIVAYFWPPYRSLIGSQIGTSIIFLILILSFLGVNFIGAIIQPLANAAYQLTTIFGILIPHATITFPFIF